jgi:hypothetical protein
LSENEDCVCRLKKTLYELKQAHRAWYSILDKYLQQNVFRRGTIDINLYIKHEDMLIVLIFLWWGISKRSFRLSTVRAIVIDVSNPKLDSSLELIVKDRSCIYS